jgi:hypothetical protein
VIGRTQPRPALPAAYRIQLDHLRAQTLAVVDAHIGLAQECGHEHIVDLLLDLRIDVAAVITRGGGGRG